MQVHPHEEKIKLSHILYRSLEDFGVLRMFIDEKKGAIQLKNINKITIRRRRSRSSQVSILCYCFAHIVNWFQMLIFNSSKQQKLLSHCIFGRFSWEIVASRSVSFFSEHWRWEGCWKSSFWSNTQNIFDYYYISKTSSRVYHALNQVSLVEFEQASLKEMLVIAISLQFGHILVVLHSFNFQSP